MSHLLKNLNQKYYIAFGIGIALIFLIIGCILYNIYYLIHPFVIVSLFLLIIALVKIVSKTFTPHIYKTIIMLLIGAIIATSLRLRYTISNYHHQLDLFDINTFIVIVVCVVVLWYTLTVKKREEARTQEEISPQQKIAQRELNLLIIKVTVGGGLIVIGIIGALSVIAGLLYN
ncbi:MAG: hypothetical protein ACTSP9_03610 [Promethearchaeota archaeon]